MKGRAQFNEDPVDVIIPTYDNLHQLLQCLSSMWVTRGIHKLRFIIVNNGKIPLERYIEPREEVLILNPGENLGWTGGLAYGLKHSTSQYVCFANDDIYIPNSSWRWMQFLVRTLHEEPQVAATGPLSNMVMGQQNIWNTIPCLRYSTSYLIGFCMLVRRKALDEIGGIDTSFNTGDDIDLSIRFRKAGYHLYVDAQVFVYHHGFQTGEKIYGGPNIAGGWNSRKMTDDTNAALIRKHGFYYHWLTMTNQEYPEVTQLNKPHEIHVILPHVYGYKPEEIVELGCGGNKTVPECTGVDLVIKGEPVPNMNQISQADVAADISKRMPFEDGRFKLLIARHCLEHCVDTIETLKEWKRIVADDGKLVISLPDERFDQTIVLNPEHVHAFTPESFKNLAEAVGMKVESIDDMTINGSFVTVLKKEEALCV